PGRNHVGHRAYRESVVAHNSPSHADHVCPRRSALFVLAGALPQPVIERRLSAVELRQIVVGRKFFGRADRTRTDRAGARAHLFHGARVLSRRASRGLAAGGLSSMAWKRTNSVSDRAK